MIMFYLLTFEVVFFFYQLIIWNLNELFKCGHGNFSLTVNEMSTQVLEVATKGRKTNGQGFLTYPFVIDRIYLRSILASFLGSS